jgi:hypothetical protein
LLVVIAVVFFFPFGLIAWLRFGRHHERHDERLTPSPRYHQVSVDEEWRYRKMRSRRPYPSRMPYHAHSVGVAAKLLAEVRIWATSLPRDSPTVRSVRSLAGLQQHL